MASPDVVTLATLNAAIEDILEIMDAQDITSLEYQTEFLVQVLEGWSSATATSKSHEDDSPDTIAYQGRILVSVFTLVQLYCTKSKPPSRSSFPKRP